MHNTKFYFTSGHYKELPPPPREHPNCGGRVSNTVPANLPRNDHRGNHKRCDFHMKTRILIFQFQVIQFKQTFKSFKGRRPPTQLSGPANAAIPPADPTSPGPCTRLLTGVSALLVVLTLPWSLALCIKVTLPVDLII